MCFYICILCCLTTKTMTMCHGCYIYTYMCVSKTMFPKYTNKQNKYLISLVISKGSMLTERVYVQRHKCTNNVQKVQLFMYIPFLQTDIFLLQQGLIRAYVQMRTCTKYIQIQYTGTIVKLVPYSDSSILFIQYGRIMYASSFFKAWPITVKYCRI